VAPALSTARYKYFQLPLTFTYVSSNRQLEPTGRLRAFPVGTLISERPPDSSEQAQFGHSAPTLGV